MTTRRFYNTKFKRVRGSKIRLWRLEGDGGLPLRINNNLALYLGEHYEELRLGAFHGFPGFRKKVTF